VNAIGGILVQLMLFFWVYTPMTGVTLKMEAVRFSETSEHTAYNLKEDHQLVNNCRENLKTDMK
jgi:hypothetical protein